MPVIRTIKLENSDIEVFEFTDGSILLEWAGNRNSKSGKIPMSKADIAQLYFAFFPHTHYNDTDNDDINVSEKADNETQEYFNDQM